MGRRSPSIISILTAVKPQIQSPFFLYAEYNLIENGSFNNTDEYWNEIAVETDLINGQAVKAVKLTGGLPSYNVGYGLARTAEENAEEELILEDHISSTTQNVKIDGEKGDTYSVGGWFKGLFDDNYISQRSASINAHLLQQRTNSSDEIIGFDWVNGVDPQTTYYYLKNLQGDITGIVSASGKLEVSFNYDVWGKVTTDYHVDSSSPLGALQLINKVYISILNPFGYRGYCLDGYTDLYYLQSRYYDPNTGRFINADDTNYLNATGTVLGCNLFAYCENDPVNKVDPKGTITFKGDNPRDGTKSALKKFVKNILKKEKNITIKITKDSKGVYGGKITYKDKSNKKKTLKFVIGTKSKWENLTKTSLVNNQSFANELGWVVHEEILNISSNETPSSFAPLGIVCVAGIALYFGSQYKYDNFIIIYDSVYGKKGLDPYNIRYYFLMRIKGVDKYEGWYAIPDNIGRVIKVQ